MVGKSGSRRVGWCGSQGKRISSRASKGALERRHSKYRKLIANSNFEIIVKLAIKVRDSAENALEFITNLSYYLRSIELK